VPVETAKGDQMPGDGLAVGDQILVIDFEKTLARQHRAPMVLIMGDRDLFFENDRHLEAGGCLGEAAACATMPGRARGALRHPPGRAGSPGAER
jgi:hypothetical protein